MNLVYIGKQTHENYLAHHGVKGQSWGKRRYQNADGSLTLEGRYHYGYGPTKVRSGTYDDGTPATDMITLYYDYDYRTGDIARAGYSLDEKGKKHLNEVYPLEGEGPGFNPKLLKHLNRQDTIKNAKEKIKKSWDKITNAISKALYSLGL